MNGGNRTRDFARIDEPQKDVELTLQPLMVVAVGGGLLALCFICFVIGYVAGKHSGVPVVAQKQTETQPLQAASTPAAKPSAVSASPRVQSAPAVASEDDTDSEDTAPASTPASAPVPSQQPVTQATPQVHPALPVQTSQPAQAAGVMVQVAAVSQMEDAQVLVGALRKRGFAAAIRHDGVDGKLHVQVGPFTNRNDANAACQRLLNEGYNAVVQ